MWAHLRVRPSLRLLELANDNFPLRPMMSRLRSWRDVKKFQSWKSGVSPIETACVAADLGVQSSVLCRDFIKDGDKRPMPVECAAITVDEADEYVDVVGSSTPVHSYMESEGLTFRESVNHPF